MQDFQIEGGGGGGAKIYVRPAHITSAKSLNDDRVQSSLKGIV